MTRKSENLAVLFADISESAQLYSLLGDSVAQRVVHRCLSRIIDIIGRHNGRVIKTIGDEVMCVFSLADAAVSAAIEMQSITNASHSAAQPVRIHIGLHFGPVLVENSDVFGDTVNAAAYLTAVAAAEQILTTEATEKALSEALRSTVRPVFKTMLKGATQESTIYQVLWYADTEQLTDVNMRTHKTIPGDEGSLVLTHRNMTIRLDQQRPNITIGRDQKCDLVIHEKMASRRHLSIRLLRTHFYLLDQSTNGTFVQLDSGETVHVLRAELLLDAAAGKISPGRSISEGATEIITFVRDRRSMYRV